ncbi:MAG: ATP synthase F1 subunit epsilon [Alphaproteobacteria bacterium]|nr:ATP synthase F1 subunit epsilon [Alphaproteobacteria bacterium]
MSENTIQFELVSPEEKLISQPVQMAVIPGEEGEFGVQVGHSALVASLKPGVVTLTDEQGEKRKIFITGGFADVTAQLCTVLAEEAVNVDDLDVAAIEQQLANLKEDLGLAAEALDKARINKKIALAKARLSAATGQLVA